MYFNIRLGVRTIEKYILNRVIRRQRCRGYASLTDVRLFISPCLYYTLPYF